MSYRRTEYSEPMQIPQSSRGFFLRNRDSIRETHHVELFFPRDQCAGAYQTMIIKGGPVSIGKARVRLNQILVEANQEFHDYKQRQSRRNHWKRKMVEQTAPISPSPKLAKKNSVIKNPFAVLLDGDDGLAKKPAEKVTEEFPVLVREGDELARKERRQAERRERIAKRKEAESMTQMPMSFAEAAAAADEIEVDNVELRGNIPSDATPTMSWGDMVDSDSDDDDL